VETLPNDAIEAYWTNYRSFVKKDLVQEEVYELERLLEYKRFFRALDIIASSHPILPTELITKVLREAAQNPSSDRPIRDIHFQAGKIFKELDTREDVGEETMQRLEWLWLPILSEPVRSGRPPRSLYKYLQSSPEFFVDVIRLIYKPEGRDRLEEEMTQGQSLQQVAERAESCHQLIENWNLFPGANEKGEIIHKEALKSWIDKARELGLSHDREKAVDNEIGKMLGRISGPNDSWPTEVVCDIIEEINTDDMRSGFHSGIYHSFIRGLHARGPDGAAERRMAEYFEGLARQKDIQWPTIAGILRDISKWYKARAAQEDVSGEWDALEY